MDAVIIKVVSQAWIELLQTVDFSVGLSCFVCFHQLL